MSHWKNHNFESRIRSILTASVYKKDTSHHLGRPFLSPYQISIEYDRQFPHVAQSMALIVGGKNSNVCSSLAQYIGRQLSTRIKKNEITDIEGGFFSNQNLEEIRFDYDGKKIISSATGSNADLSMYRIKQSKTYFMS